MKTPIVALASGALLFHAGCATHDSAKTAYPKPGQRALVVFKITHFDRAGETGTVIHKTGEIVTIARDGDAVIATPEGDIIHCPAKALYPVTHEIVAVLDAPRRAAPDCIAVEELKRWFPADKVPFTLRWLPSGEIVELLQKAGVPR